MFPLASTGSPLQHQWSEGRDEGGPRGPDMTQVARGSTQGRDIMFGRYRLLGRIAAGGMAEVWAAQLLAAGGFCKSMVIKRVLPELAENPSFLRMLMTEARVAARLSHTNICSVFELGDVDGEYYIAMEYLRGAPLTHLLKAGGGLDPAAAVSIVAQACDGLHYAHEQRDASGNLLGLVHRDVSPHNLFVTVDGILKVLDFGIAKVDDGSSERTEAGKVKGKLAYMSPEQLAADALDRRSDVWSLGAVLWELVTGRRLFAGGPAQLVDGIRNARVPTLASAGIDCPALDDVLARAICRKEWRYATVADLRKAMLAAIMPLVPAPPDEIAQLVWARCGDEIRSQDKRFEQVEANGIDPVVDRLPLRAEQTQVSQEMYVRDGEDASGLAAVIENAEPVLRRSRAPTADTSPEVPAAVALEMQEEEERRAEAAAEAAAAYAAEAAVAAEAAAAAMASATSGRKRIVTLIVAAAVLGMAVGVVVHGLRGRDERAPEASAKPEPAAAAKVEPLAAAPAPKPAPVAAPTPAPVRAPVAAPVADKKPDPPKRAAKPAPKRVAKVDPAPPEPPKKVTKPDPEPPRRVVKADPGKLYMDAKPWATIYVD